MTDAPHHDDNIITLRPAPGGLVAAIASVMSELDVVPKRGLNKFHGYKYVAMDDLAQSLTPLLGRHGLVIWQSELERSLFDDGNVIAIKYAFRVSHVSGEGSEVIERTGMSRCRDSKGGYDDKAINKCATSARKYFLLSLFQCPVDDDSDADVGHNDRPPERRPAPRTYQRPPTERESPRARLERQLRDSAHAPLPNAEHSVPSVERKVWAADKVEYDIHLTERERRHPMRFADDRNEDEIAWRRAEREADQRRQQEMAPFTTARGPEPPPHDDDDIPAFLDRRGKPRRTP